MPSVNAGVVVGDSTGGGGLNGLLKATIFVEMGTAQILGVPTPGMDVMLGGPPDPNFGEWVGVVSTVPAKYPQNTVGLTPAIAGPDYSAGALVIDPNQTFFIVIDTATGGGDALVLSPTGTPTPLTLPPNGFWVPAAPSDWAIQEQIGSDLAFDASGNIVSVAGGIYAAMWQVNFSEVPTA